MFQIAEFCNTCEGGPPTADGTDWTQWTAGTGANPCLLADPNNPNAAPVPLTDPPSDYNLVDPTYHNSGSTATTCNGFFTCPAGTELAFGVLELNGQTACVALPYSDSLDRSFVCPSPANAPMTPALACGTLA
ncbi:hypothetical protein WR25_20192 [Diploscapter pachys]|uniref:Uncharacterized protein n=1 Tax=Diploscapter pachys TaxID=2018661 RepID=A0A2A2JTK7_9BILA|nr:hypothetical protein WR25_20192 [Diploscapter pachys]